METDGQTSVQMHGPSTKYPAQAEVERLAGQVERFEQANGRRRMPTIVDTPPVQARLFPDRLARYWELRQNFSHFRSLLKELEDGNERVADILARAAERLAKSARDFAEEQTRK